MALTLYFHPLSSYCHKALIAFYENGIPFTPHTVDLSNAESREAFFALWPVGKFPVLEDGDRVIPESTIIIEYLAQHYPGPVRLIPVDADAAREVRAIDRFFDLHVHAHMQRITAERLRPADQKDPYGLAQAEAALTTALTLAEQNMATRRWAAGDQFTLADCAAAPALFYVDLTMTSLAGPYPHLAAYLGRLKARPSYARALAEAQPYLHMVPR